ncbi:unnamed protein product, partial [Amoebophrya sp. A25]|eukprot:GSA25T00003696001.1
MREIERIARKYGGSACVSFGFWVLTIIQLVLAVSSSREQCGSSLWLHAFTNTISFDSWAHIVRDLSA